MTHREEQLILKRIEDLENHQKEQNEKIEFLDNLIKVLTDGLTKIIDETI